MTVTVENLYGTLYLDSDDRIPFTVSVPVKRIANGGDLALYDRRWRKIYLQAHRMYIMYRGTKIFIQVEAKHDPDHG